MLRLLASGSYVGRNHRLRPSAITRLTGNTVRLAGATPKLHCRSAPIVTCCAIAISCQSLFGRIVTDLRTITAHRLGRRGLSGLAILLIIGTQLRLRLACVWVGLGSVKHLPNCQLTTFASGNS